MKDAKRIAAKPLKPAMQARRMVVLTGTANHAHRRTAVSVSTGNCAPRHGWRHGRAASRASLRVLQHGCVALCTVVRPWVIPVYSLRVSFDLYSSSILPSIPPESYFSHQNPKVLSGSTDKPQYKYN